MMELRQLVGFANGKHNLARRSGKAATTESVKGLQVSKIQGRTPNDDFGVREFLSGLCQ